MTNKERALKTLKQMYYGGRYLETGSLISLEVLEDFGMAIKALEKESCEDAVSRRRVFSAIHNTHLPKKYEEPLWNKVSDLPPATPASKDDILDKIRSEIEEQKEEHCFDDDDMYVYREGLNAAIGIIDKYREAEG